MESGRRYIEMESGRRYNTSAAPKTTLKERVPETGPAKPVMSMAFASPFAFVELLEANQRMLDSTDSGSIRSYGVMKVIKKKYTSLKDKMDKTTRQRTKKMVIPLIERMKEGGASSHHHVTLVKAEAQAEGKAETQAQGKGETQAEGKGAAEAKPVKWPQVYHVETKYPTKNQGNMETRERIRTRLRSVLADISTSDPVLAQSSQVSADDLAIVLECEMFQKFGLDTDSAGYKDFYRLLRSALRNKSNVHLQRLLLTGGISGRKVVEYTTEDFESKAQKDARADVVEYHRALANPAKLAQSHASVSDQFPCSKCKAKQTTYYQLQTRSADEPMTTFCTCIPCGHSWRF
ncbi:hypothetical protein KIPB_001180 [Kipferlia bialata]|uniref:Transcription elongation factor S-II n=1 Tax=Kipferlia bialata TaxID=797122 RepID=A0A9K3CPQ7_9EUKA|nr:hypothetical protein KIPB_001180 [Kipferlia bialata]|eukprot:g1180.t1